MEAYSALLSLSHTLDRIFILHQYSLLLNKKKLVSLQGNVTALMAFLEDYSSKYRGVVNPLESRIVDAAYQAEDIVETWLLSPFHSAFSSNDFNKVLKEINSILEELMNDQAEPISLPDFSDSAVQSTITHAGDVDYTVGLDVDFMEIKDQMYQDSSSFNIIPIYGMGGIGKTTLATRLYEDSIKMQWFDRRIWVAVSQDYSRKNILLEILQSMKKSVNESSTNGELEQIVYQELYGRRYLLVADDVWTEEAWDILNRVLPKDTAGSQVLVTTRLQSVANYAGSTCSQKEVQFLSEEQSWRLLVSRVFGKGSCPSQLEQIGMKIAKCCRGLPLMIVVVAGLLKEDITEAYWRNTLNMISSSARSDLVEHCSKVLSLSYDQLPLFLKPCFIYVTAFPEDCEVEADLLVRLWMAEGFVKATGSKCLEEVAQGYLNDLVGRSLLIGSKKSYSNKVRAVKLHDSLRAMGILESQDGKFYHWGMPRRSKNKERRVTTTKNINIQGTTIRTYLNTGHGHDLWGPFHSNRFVRVFYSPHETVKFDLKQLVLLRYVNINCYYDPKLLSKLRNLETLDVGSYDCLLPLKIWKMPFLRHVKVPNECYLEQPGMLDVVKETNLQTLSEVRNLKMTPQVIKMLANIRKLGLYYRDTGLLNRENLKLDNLIHLKKLEELKIIDLAKIDWESIWSSAVKLPISLKKLELDSVNIPWEYINRVGLILPNLEYFRINCGTTDREWNPTEGAFLKLKYLELEDVQLVHWGAERIHFPSLEILVLKGFRHYRTIQEIPSGIGEIDGLKLMELHGCNSSLVDSAKQIQEDQQEMGNEQIQLLVHESN